MNLPNVIDKTHSHSENEFDDISSVSLHSTLFNQSKDIRSGESTLQAYSCCICGIDISLILDKRTIPLLAVIIEK